MQAVSCASRQLQLLELKANYGFLSRLNSQPPEPGIIGFYRRQNALRMRAEGDSIEKIAGFVKSTFDGCLAHRPATLDRYRVSR